MSLIEILVEIRLRIPNGTTSLTICTLELQANTLPKKGYPSELSHYGAVIRRARMDLNLTQKDLATTLGVYTSTIDKWERQRTVPNEISKVKIKEFLGYDPIDIITH